MLLLSSITHDNMEKPNPAKWKIQKQETRVGSSHYRCGNSSHAETTERDMEESKTCWCDTQIRNMNNIRIMWRLMLLVSIIFWIWSKQDKTQDLPFSSYTLYYLYYYKTVFKEKNGELTRSYQDKNTRSIVQYTQWKVKLHTALSY